MKTETKINEITGTTLATGVIADDGNEGDEGGAGAGGFRPKLEPVPVPEKEDDDDAMRM